MSRKSVKSLDDAIPKSSFGRRPSSEEPDKGAGMKLKSVPKPDDDELKLDEVSRAGRLYEYGNSRSTPQVVQTVDEEAEVSDQTNDSVQESAEAQAKAETSPAPQSSAPVRKFSLGIEPKSRVRVHVSKTMISEIDSLRNSLPALNLTAISGTMWSLYKADMGVVFAEDGSLADFDVIKQQKLLVAGASAEPTDVLIFPVTESHKRELTTLKKSVSGLVYRAILERMWALYKEEMQFTFEGGELKAQ